MENDVIINQTDSINKISEDKNRGKTIIDVMNLSAYFGKTKVLKEISLSIPKNKVVAIIGPSGCGKSTFLRSINRMHEVVGGTITGEIFLDGNNIMKFDPVLLRRKVGMVFQKPNPFPTMSIFNNVVAGLRLNGVRNKNKLKIGRAHV